MITIKTFRRFPDRTFGLGQDVSTNLADIVRVPALFVKESRIHHKLADGRLKQVTIDEGAPQEIYDRLSKALESTRLSHHDLVSINSKYGRKKYASGLIRAVFDGQKGAAAITDWPANNYLAVAIGMGLVDLDYASDEYFVTDLGRQAVQLLDEGLNKELRDFMFQRLLEYPYAAWLIRLVNKDTEKKYTKFDLGENFGFIDEPGFTSLPEHLYVDAMLDAEIAGDKKRINKIRSDYESTADKYMRWLAGVFVDYGLLKKTQKKSPSKDGHSVTMQAYKATLECTRALNMVNGGSRFKRSKKRVRWEYLAPKVENASKRKTARALMLMFLSQYPSGLDAADLSQKINDIEQSIKSIPEQIVDDAKGLNRLGIEISITGTRLCLKEDLYDFVIPMKENTSFKSTQADTIKRELLPKLKYLDHGYLQAVDIAYKKNTSNSENTMLEFLSAQLFTKEMGYSGKHLGGSNKPDAFVYDSQTGWILDSKAYSNGFAVTARTTDAMGRYIEQYRDRNDKSTWWSEFPNDLPVTYFAYISSFYTGNYEQQLDDFETRNHMRGGLIEIAKLILIAEKYREKQITRSAVTENLLNDEISWDQYSKSLM